MPLVMLEHQAQMETLDHQEIPDRQVQQVTLVHKAHPVLVVAQDPEDKLELEDNQDPLEYQGQ